MIWVACFIYAIASVLLRNSFPVLGAICVFLIPLFVDSRAHRSWKEKQMHAARFLLKQGYCIHYEEDATIPNPKELCSRAGRVNCARCISEMTGVPVYEILETKRSPSTSSW